MEHGTRWSYMNGCRCSDCTAENTRYHRELRERRRAGEIGMPKVRTELVLEHLNAALEEHSIREVARRCEVSDTTIRRIIDGQEKVSLVLANRILSQL